MPDNLDRTGSAKKRSGSLPTTQKTQKTPARRLKDVEKNPASSISPISNAAAHDQEEKSLKEIFTYEPIAGVNYFTVSFGNVANLSDRLLPYLREARASLAFSPEHDETKIPPRLQPQNAKKKPSIRDISSVLAKIGQWRTEAGSASLIKNEMTYKGFQYPPNPGFSWFGDVISILEKAARRQGEKGEERPFAIEPSPTPAKTFLVFFDWDKRDFSDKAYETPTESESSPKLSEEREETDDLNISDAANHSVFLINEDGASIHFRPIEIQNLEANESEENSFSFDSGFDTLDALEGLKLLKKKAGNLPTTEKENPIQHLIAFFDAEEVPEGARAAIIKKIKIEIARVKLPKWAGRRKRGGELAELSAPLFLKQVHADFITNGLVDNEIIRAIDPDLMTAVEDYISKAKKRGNGLKDAEGLRFTLARPGPKTGTIRAGSTQPDP